jgi:hypothetical protein
MERSQTVYTIIFETLIAAMRMVAETSDSLSLSRQERCLVGLSPTGFCVRDGLANFNAI